MLQTEAGKYFPRHYSLNFLQKNGRYDVVLEPLSDTDDAIILEFKVHDPDEEHTLADTAQKALDQIERMKYSSALIAKGIPQERIRKYGFAFEGKAVWIG